MVVVNRHVAVGIGALWFFGYLPSRLLSITALLLGLPLLVSGAVFIEASLRGSGD